MFLTKKHLEKNITECIVYRHDAKTSSKQIREINDYPPESVIIIHILNNMACVR